MGLYFQRQPEVTSLLAVDFLVSRNDANKNDNMCLAQCHPTLGMCEGQRSFEILMGKLIKAKNSAHCVNSASRWIKTKQNKTKQNLSFGTQFL